MLGGSAGRRGACSRRLPRLHPLYSTRRPPTTPSHSFQALETFGTEVGIAFSGAEDVALVEYAHLTGRPYRVFSLDTGRLNPETYRLFDAVEKHYGIKIEYTFPDAQETMDFVREKASGWGGCGLMVTRGCYWVGLGGLWRAWAAAQP